MNVFKVNESDKICLLNIWKWHCHSQCLYVNDLLIFGSNIHAINIVKSLLCNNFDMKDLREVSVNFGIKITGSEKGFFIGLITLYWKNLKEIQLPWM